MNTPIPSERSVIAVIPHYNMPQTLMPLIRQILADHYDAVYVLDDNSSNCDIREVLKPFGDSVSLIAGKENVGAGRNRNRILEAESRLLKGSIIHFIDADTELLTTNNPARARELLADPSIGEIGGLIIDKGGLQYSHNYNPRISIAWCLTVWIQGLCGVLAEQHPRLAKKLRRLFSTVLSDFPDMFAKPLSRDVWCLAEANTLVPYDTFRAVGGFSGKLRFQEAADFGYRLEAKGLRRRFDPSIAVRHLGVQVRGNQRGLENLHGIYTVAREHGLPWR